MDQLQVFFFPFMAQGHMIPTLDIAKLFSSHGIKTSIITTPLNAHHFTKVIPKTQIENEIKIQIIKFPSTDTGLPDNCENTDHIPRELLPNFFRATFMLKDQIEQILKEHQPDCLIADMFFPWATDIAAKYKIPRLVFHGTNFFTLCVSESIRLYKPQRSVLSDDELFNLPNLPHEIKMKRTQLARHQSQRMDTEPETEIGKMLREAKESEVTSFGVIVNSFYELEPDYADHYRNVMRRRAWHIGPVSLCNRYAKDKAQRGKSSDIDEYECLNWLNSKNPNSVIYICFGSMAEFSSSQLHEIAMALEETGINFIWVVRKMESNEKNEKWLPEGFEERTKEMGLIIRGWAPQVLILDHVALGGFLTHCGWNSTLESITAGVPMVTWPLAADQFYNEKLVTEVLKIGVGVGASHWSSGGAGVSIRKDTIAKAIKRVMVGEEAKEMRNRAKELKEMAKKAVEKGGSSYSDLKVLLQELSSYGA